MAARIERIWLLVGAAVVAAVVIVVVVATSGSDKSTSRPSTPLWKTPAASPSASAPKTAPPSAPSLNDPVVRSRFESAMSSFFVSCAASGSAGCTP